MFFLGGGGRAGGGAAASTVIPMQSNLHRPFAPTPPVHSPSARFRIAVCRGIARVPAQLVVATSPVRDVLLLDLWSPAAQLLTRLQHGPADFGPPLAAPVMGLQMQHLGVGIIECIGIWSQVPCKEKGSPSGATSCAVRIALPAGPRLLPHPAARRAGGRARAQTCCTGWPSSWILETRASPCARIQTWWWHCRGRSTPRPPLHPRRSGWLREQPSGRAFSARKAKCTCQI